MFDCDSKKWHKGLLLPNFKKLYFIQEKICELLIQFEDNSKALTSKKMLETNVKIILELEKAFFFKMLDKYKFDNLLHY